VLVTEAKTYSVRLVESTNTALLILPDEEEEKGAAEGVSASPSKKQKTTTTKERLIVGQVSCHYELVETNPPISSLRQLLAAKPYTGAEDEQQDQGGAQGFETQSQESQTISPASAASGLYSTERLRRVFQASDCQLYESLASVGTVLVKLVMIIDDDDDNYDDDEAICSC
jgi:hypothetical protein